MTKLKGLKRVMAKFKFAKSLKKATVNFNKAYKNKLTRKISRTAKQTDLVNQQTELLKAKENKFKAQAEANKAKTMKYESGSGFWSRHKRKQLARTEAKVAKSKGEAELSLKSPEFAETRLKGELALKKEGIKQSANAAKYAAIGAGATTLGKGLSDENNQDAREAYDAEKEYYKNLGNMFNNVGKTINPTSGLTEGVE